MMAIQDLLGRPHMGGELRLLVLTSVSTCRGAFDTLGETLATARDLRMRLRLVSRHGESVPTEVAVLVDGKVVARFERLREGTFALQAHDPDSKVYFRNLRVKKLD